MMPSYIVTYRHTVKTTELVEADTEEDAFRQATFLEFPRPVCGPRLTMEVTVGPVSVERAPE